MSEREQILKMLADNANTINDNISEFLIRNTEDLEAAGVEPLLLAESLLTVASAHLVKTFGARAASDQLLKAAGIIDNLARAEGCSQASRH